MSHAPDAPDLLHLRRAAFVSVVVLRALDSVVLGVPRPGISLAKGDIGDVTEGGEPDARDRMINNLEAEISAAMRNQDLLLVSNLIQRLLALLAVPLRALRPPPDLDIGDVVQETYVRALARMPTFDFEAGPPLRAYLLGVARRVILEMRSRRHARGRAVDLSYLENVGVDAPELAAVESEEECAWIAAPEMAPRDRVTSPRRGRATFHFSPIAPTS